MNEQDVLERAVTALNEAMLDDSLWAPTSARIEEAVGSRGSFLAYGMAQQGRGMDIRVSRYYSRGEELLEAKSEYFREYRAVDEHVSRKQLLADGVITVAAKLFSERERKTSAMYNEWLLRNEGQDGLHLRLYGSGGLRISLALANPVDDDGWTSGRLKAIANLGTHLRQYVQVRCALADAEAVNESISGLLANSRMGVVQLDWSGRIVEANDRAVGLLLRNDGLVDNAGFLRAERVEDDVHLQKLLAGAIPQIGNPGASGSMLIRRSSHQPRLTLHVKPVSARETDVRSWRVAALVLVVDPMDRLRVDPRWVQEALELTPAEAEVSTLLAEGRTPHQIAVATDRGYHTVRAHLKNIYAKLGVSRQFDLAQIVLGLANFPVATDPECGQ